MSSCKQDIQLNDSVSKCFWSPKYVYLFYYIKQFDICSIPYYLRMCTCKMGTNRCFLSIYLKNKHVKLTITSLS